MKKIFPYFLIFLSFLVTYSIFPVTIFAQAPEEWTSNCYSLKNVGGTVIKVATIQGFECIFRNIVRILVPVAGVLLFIMLIVGSFQLMTAGSDPKQAQKAKATLTYAIIGLVVFFGIWFILLLIKAITGIDVTKFAIPGPL